MTQPLPSETLEYERYVDGLRRSHGLLLTALQYMVSWAERHDLTRAALINGGQAEVPVITIARDAITSAQAVNASPVSAKTITLSVKQGIITAPDGVPQTITIHVESGMVQDVTGVPAGYELRVEDYDVQDPGDDSWDAEKECAVTVYEGGGV